VRVTSPRHVKNINVVKEHKAVDHDLSPISSCEDAAETSIIIKTNLIWLKL
jgi:hypothetical protein